MVSVFVAILSGMVSHQTHHIFKQMPQRYWVRNARYIVGILSSVPAYLLMREEQKKRGSDSTLDNLSYYILLFASVGFGVQVGYLLDHMLGRNGMADR